MFFSLVDRFWRRGKRENSITYEEARTIMKNDNTAMLLDVRSPQEFNEGHLENAINVPLYDVENYCNKIYEKTDNTIIVYCQSGARSKKAIEILEKKGFTRLYNIQGGLEEI